VSGTKTKTDPGNLSDLLVAAHESASDTSDDHFFDELDGLESDPAATPAAPSPAPAASAPAPATAAPALATSDQDDATDEDEAAAAVRAAIAAVEPDLQVTSAADNEELGKPDRAAFEPVERPNGESYIPRPLFHLTDVEALRRAREADSPVMLSGFPGCGKTAVVEAAFGDELITANAHGDMEVTDLIGTYTPQPDGSYEWVDGPLTEAMKSGKVLFVDDITLAPATVLARLYPAMDGRKRITLPEHRSETVEAADGFFVVGAHNPGVPGAIFSEPLRSRFIVPITIETDLRMALKMGVESRIVNATAALHKQRASGTISWAPEMRELLAFKRNQQTFGSGFAVNALIGAAPEDTQDTIAATLRTWYPKAETLRVSAGS